MLFKKIFPLILSLSLIWVSACDDDNGSPTGPDEKMDEFALVAEVGDKYYTDYTTSEGLSVNLSISGTGGLYDLLTDNDTSNDPFIIDYRSATDFATGHIAGSVNIPLSELIDKINDGTIPTDKRIVNVCYTGQTASVATAVLNMLGYEAQDLLFGMSGVTTDSDINGTSKWSDQIASDEFTLTTTSTGKPSVEYDFPVLNTGKSTAGEIIKARFDNVSPWGVTVTDIMTNSEEYFIVNYWSEDDYSTIGHIEGAYQFTPNVAFQKDEYLKYLPTDKKIAVYCWTGQTSAQVVAYLRILGYDAYSIYFGVNGFAYGSLSSHKYLAPTGDYSAIIEK